MYLLCRVLVFIALSVSAAAVVVPPSDVAVKSLVVRDAGGLEPYSQSFRLTSMIGQWGISTDSLAKRSNNTLTYFGIATAELAIVASGSCTAAAIPALAPVAIPLCAASVAIATFTFTIFALATFVSSFNNRRDASQAASHLVQSYYHQYPGGPSVMSQMMYDFHKTGDGLPISVASTDCENFNHECQKLWYSHTPSGTARGRDIHRIHVTPAHFDYRPRQALDETLWPTQVIHMRQAPATSVTVEVTPTSGSTTEYYGGYVWSYDNDPAETAIAQDGDSMSDAQNGAAEIVNGMSDAYNSDNGKFEDLGSYCMNIEYQGNPGTGGFWYIYNDPSQEMSGADEQDFLETCEEGGG